MTRRAQVLFAILAVLFFAFALGHAQTARKAEQPDEEFHLHFGELMGLIGGIVSLMMVIVGFLLRRSVFDEIDSLREDKQDVTLCNNAHVALMERLKKGDETFTVLDKKMDRVMWALKIPPPEDTKG